MKREQPSSDNVFEHIVRCHNGKVEVNTELLNTLRDRQKAREAQHPGGMKTIIGYDDGKGGTNKKAVMDSIHITLENDKLSGHNAKGGTLSQLTTDETKAINGFSIYARIVKHEATGRDDISLYMALPKGDNCTSIIPITDDNNPYNDPTANELSAFTASIEQIRLTTDNTENQTNLYRQEIIKICKSETQKPKNKLESLKDLFEEAKSNDELEDFLHAMINTYIDLSVSYDKKDTAPSISESSNDTAPIDLYEIAAQFFAEIISEKLVQIELIKIYNIKYGVSSERVTELVGNLFAGKHRLSYFQKDVEKKGESTTPQQHNTSRYESVTDRDQIKKLLHDLTNPTNTKREIAVQKRKLLMQLSKTRRTVLLEKYLDLTKTHEESFNAWVGKFKNGDKEYFPQYKLIETTLQKIHTTIQQKLMQSEKSNDGKASPTSVTETANLIINVNPWWSAALETVYSAFTPNIPRGYTTNNRKRKKPAAQGNSNKIKIDESSTFFKKNNNNQKRERTAEDGPITSSRLKKRVRLT